VNGIKREWKSVDGNIWLMQADCLTVLPQLEAESIDMVWTDPPYGHGNGDGDFLSRRGEIMHDGRDGGQAPIANDDMASMRNVVDLMLEAVVPLLKRDCCCCCCCGGGGPSPTFAWLAERMDRKGLEFFHSVIWDKKNPGIGWRYRRQHEMLMVAHRTGGKLAWANDERKQPNIISMSKPRSDRHPNEKPLGLVLLFLANHTQEGDLVADPFMGSGTTGVACVRTGRRFIGIELDDEHYETSLARIQEEIGRMAFLEPAAVSTQRSLLED
jgi:site-specific DNA-methyltransferase (adenine-specific)